MNENIDTWVPDNEPFTEAKRLTFIFSFIISLIVFALIIAAGSLCFRRDFFCSSFIVTSILFSIFIGTLLTEYKNGVPAAKAYCHLYATPRRSARTGNFVSRETRKRFAQRIYLRATKIVHF